MTNKANFRFFVNKDVTINPKKKYNDMRDQFTLQLHDFLRYVITHPNATPNEIKARQLKAKELYNQIPTAEVAVAGEENKQNQLKQFKSHLAQINPELKEAAYSVITNAHNSVGLFANHSSATSATNNAASEQIKSVKNSFKRS